MNENVKLILIPSEKIILIFVTDFFLIVYIKAMSLKAQSFLNPNNLVEFKVCVLISEIVALEWGWERCINDVKFICVWIEAKQLLVTEIFTGQVAKDSWKFLFKVEKAIHPFLGLQI